MVPRAKPGPRSEARRQLQVSQRGERVHYTRHQSLWMRLSRRSQSRLADERASGAHRVKPDYRGRAGSSLSSAGLALDRQGASFAFARDEAGAHASVADNGGVGAPRSGPNLGTNMLDPLSNRLDVMGRSVFGVATEEGTPYAEMVKTSHGSSASVVRLDPPCRTPLAHFFAVGVPRQDCSRTVTRGLKYYTAPVRTDRAPAGRACFPCDLHFA
jgi:hypothetical protein